ncbi:MAG TPA: M48 family peptidase, partial [bacterium]|nr:M48 family peptidase [bacterium]
MFKHVFQSPFFWVFLFFYVANEITHFVLEMINLRFVARQTSVPEAFHGHITQETFEKAQAYTIEKTKFALVTRLIGIPFFWMLIFMGGLQVMDGFAAEWVGAGTLTQSVLFCLLVGAYFFFIGIPFKIYSTFVIEENHGFNQITPALFARDLVKSILLSLVLGTPVLYAVFWFMDHAGENWWLWVWLVLALFQLFVITVYPTWLAPLFNKFKEV